MKTKTFSDDMLNSINNQLSRSSQKAQALKIEANLAEQTMHWWEKLSRYVSLEWYLHILDHLNTDSVIRNAIRESDGQNSQMLEQIQSTARIEKDTLLRRFPSRIEEGCATSGLKIDRDSRHPKYKFDNGFFQVEVDDRKGIAKISNNEGLLEELPSDPYAIVDAIQREHRRIFDRTFDGKIFIKKLRHHYLEILKQQNKPDGEAIPIRNITRRLGKNEKGFRSDEFLIDLSRLVEKGPGEVDGFRFDLQQTKSTKQGMLLTEIAGAGYVGFIVFRRN